MPTTKIKNLLYRSALPFLAPNCGRHPVTAVVGHPLNDQKGFIRLLRKHHVLGSSTFLSHGNDNTLILTDSVRPCHHAEINTMYRVASITKTATAALVMKLAEERILDLDEYVSGRFTAQEAQKALDGITWRHLLSHTSGISDPISIEQNLLEKKPFPSFLPECRTEAPGKSFHYSNLGFGLIGCILEAILNQTVSRIFDEKLFQPLNMNATLEAACLRPEEIMPVTRIFWYHKGMDLKVTKVGAERLSFPDPLCHYGYTAGSMYTDIFSLASFFQVLMNGGSPYLKPDSVNEMIRQHAVYGDLSPTLSYGLGLLRIQDPMLSDGLILGHQGFAYGCADGAFWDEKTNNLMITLNGGCSEARAGRLGIANRDFLDWSFRKELPLW